MYRAARYLDKDAGGGVLDEQRGVAAFILIGIVKVTTPRR